METKGDTARIYVYYTANTYNLGDDGKIHFDGEDMAEMYIDTIIKGNSVSLRSEGTAADDETYLKDRRKNFPLLIRITMGGPGAEKYREEDAKLAEAYFSEM